MLLSQLLPLCAFPLANAYVALRFDPLIKRDNTSYAINSDSFAESSSAITTTTATPIYTVDANGQPTTLWTTQTIVYYTTVEQMLTPSDVSVSTGSDLTTDADSTVTSVILTTVTLADSTSVEAVGTTTYETNAAAASSNSLLSLAGVGQFDASPNSLSSSGISAAAASATTTAVASATTTAAAVTGSVESSQQISTVTVTVSASDCVPVSYSTIVQKYPLVAEFTFTGSDGELFTATTSTDVEQTTTSVIYLTSTLSASTTTFSNGSTTTFYYDSTTTVPSSVLFGNGTAASLVPRELSEEYVASPGLLKRLLAFL